MEKEREIKQTPQLEKGYIQIATMENITRGATIWARKTIESEIFFKKPAEWFKIWFYIVSKVSHTNGSLFKRGEGFFNFTIEKKYLMVSDDQIKKCLQYLRKVKMISTRRSTRGIVIFVCNYNLYQNLSNYKSTIQSTKEAREKHESSTTIYNNEKNEKNENNIYIPPLTTNQTPIYKTKDYLKKIIEDKEFCFKERKEHFSQKNAINATIVEIQREAEKSLNWLEANGKVKKNYRAFLHNWLIKSFGYKFRQ